MNPEITQALEGSKPPTVRYFLRTILTEKGLRYRLKTVTRWEYLERIETITTYDLSVVQEKLKGGGAN